MPMSSPNHVAMFWLAICWTMPETFVCVLGVKAILCYTTPDHVVYLASEDAHERFNRVCKATGMTEKLSAVGVQDLRAQITSPKNRSATHALQSRGTAWCSVAQHRTARRVALPCAASLYIMSPLLTIHHTACFIHVGTHAFTRVST